MPDIRLIRPRGSGLWISVGGLVVLGVLVWAAAFFFGDPTARATQHRVGARADFGAERAPVLPMQAAPFSSVKPLSRSDLGRLVRIRGVALSPVVRNAVWVRAEDGRRILLRFQPPPPAGALRGVGPGRELEMEGYVTGIAQAEIKVWADSLGVSLPRPPPGAKFGEVPDSSFERIDALFMRNYYLSVRPDALARTGGS